MTGFSCDFTRSNHVFNHVYCSINGKSDTNLYEALMSVLVASAVRGAETEHIRWRLMKIGRGLNTFISEETLHKKRIIEPVLVKTRLRQQIHNYKKV